MTSHTVEGACAFAWRTYLLHHKGIDENDDRRSALHRYVERMPVSVISMPCKWPRYCI
jgi:hypothetical protein